MQDTCLLQCVQTRLTPPGFVEFEPLGQVKLFPVLLDESAIMKGGACLVRLGMVRIVT